MRKRTSNAAAIMMTLKSLLPDCVGAGALGTTTVRTASIVGSVWTLLGETAVPHLSQNLAPATSGAPHPVHANTASTRDDSGLRAPHLVQKVCPSASGDPQFTQTMLISAPCPDLSCETISS